MFGFNKKKIEVDTAEIEEYSTEKQYEEKEGFIYSNTDDIYEVGKDYEKTFRVFVNPCWIFNECKSLNAKIYKVIGFVEKKSGCFIAYRYEYNFADKITVLQEMKWDDLKETICSYFPMVETETEYEIAKEKGYYEFALSKFREKSY